MELAKEPKTELEYWETIEFLGGYVYKTMRWINRGEMEDADGSARNSAQKAQTIQSRLARELVEKFGVILPTGPRSIANNQTVRPAPEGQIHYWDWYNKWEREYSLIKYNKLLCSACPFSQGLGVFISQHQVSCTFSGHDGISEHNHRHIRLCPKIRLSEEDGREKITLSDIRSRILTEHGDAALNAFMVKEHEVGSQFRDYVSC